VGIAKSSYRNDLVQLGHVLFTRSRSPMVRVFRPSINAQPFGRVGSNVNGGGRRDGVWVLEVIPSRGQRSWGLLWRRGSDSGRTRVLVHDVCLKGTEPIHRDKTQQWLSLRDRVRIWEEVLPAHDCVIRSAASEEGRWGRCRRPC
jgi:hypothetical protein